MGIEEDIEPKWRITMNQKLQKRLSQFIADAQRIKKEVKWQDTLTKKLAALLYALAIVASVYAEDMENSPAKTSVTTS